MPTSKNTDGWQEPWPRLHKLLAESRENLIFAQHTLRNHGLEEDSLTERILALYYDLIEIRRTVAARGRQSKGDSI